MNTLALYRPITIEKALDDFDRYMESFFGESPLTPARNTIRPAVDVRETDGAYVLEAELPGYDEKAIEIHVDGGVLTIASKKEEQSEKKEEQFIIRERRSASFSRSFKLPENADPDTISAQFSDGLLNLEIKKRAETKKRLIAIEKK
ncbi:MAG: Hsp20/alpha crystallin family protein [Treponema sp.]|jgi:HSP20 family protein|nr:Hsp20/alpha crystallin family protein [Treponema sp.]